MRPWKVLLGTVGVFSFCFLARGTEWQPSPSYAISLEEQLPVPALGNTPFFGGVQCGGDGTYIYFRQLRHANPPAAPIIRLNVADGQHRFFYVDNIPDLPNSDKFLARDFAVNGSDLYVLGHVKDAASIVQYSASGQPKRIIKIDQTMHEAMRLLPLESGNYLIAGSRIQRTSLPTGDQRILVSASLGMYDHSGKFIKDVVLDADSAKGKQKISELFIDDRSALSLAAMVSTGDHAYIIPRLDGDPTLYMIDAAGSVTHMKLKNPLEGATVDAIRVSAERILLHYSKAAKKQNESDRSLFVQYDLASGDEIARYVPSPEFVGVFACFDWRNTFSQLSSDNRSVFISTGVAR